MGASVTWDQSGSLVRQVIRKMLVVPEAMVRNEILVEEVSDKTRGCRGRAWEVHCTGL
jgi:hypothetical protein